MAATVAAAVRRGVTVGAHPSYRDLADFGRRSMDVPSGELTAQILQQLEALDAAAGSRGARIRYVKPHGALYNRIVHDEHQAAAVVEAIGRYAHTTRREPLPLLGLPGSAVLELAGRAGIPTITEAFADRGYRSDGTLVPRDLPGAVVDDPGQVAARVVAIARGEPIAAVDGSTVTVTARSVCVHSDTPGAAGLAAGIRAALERSGIRVTAFLAAGTDGRLPADPGPDRPGGRRA